MTEAFRGFSDETLAFYEGLAADNSKAYWQDHRDVFERAVRGPMTALLAALEPEFGPAKLFRPYRDIRFSKDKTPYKTEQGAVVAHPGGAASWYVRVDGSGLLLGGGVMSLATDQLARYRAALDADRTGKPFATAVERLLGKRWTTMGDTLIRVPRGFDPGHPRAELLRHKSLALVLDLGDPGWFTTPACLDEVVRGWRAVSPVLDWLGKHVGPSQPTP